MAYNGSRSSLKRFNKDYGLNISLDDYIEQAQRTSPDEALKNILKEAYKVVATRDLITRGLTKSTDFILGFNIVVTEMLNWELPDNLKPSKDIGLNKLQQYSLAEEALGELPQNDVDIVMENYKNGNIRIRDMRAFVNDVRALNPTNIEKASFKKIAAYSEALRKINESRPGWWRFIHPFRNRAERNEANNFADYAKSINGQRAFENTVTIVNEQTSPAIGELKQNTLETMLGVSNVNDYVPEVVLSDDELKQQVIDNWFKKYRNNIGNDKNHIIVDSLEENIYNNNGDNPKIEDNEIDQPKLDKSF